MYDEWKALADRVAGHAQNFLDGLTRLANGEGGDAFLPLLLVEVSQLSLAGAQLAPDQRVGDALVYRFAEAHVLDRVEGVVPDARASAMAEAVVHRPYPARPLRKCSRQSPITETW